jgi:hypothetical protein
LIVRTEEKFDIAGKRYSMVKLGTSAGAKVLPKVLALAGKLDSPGALLACLEELDVNALAEPFAKATWVLGEGTRMNLAEIYEEHFAGDYEGLVLWLVGAVKYNFGPFFKSLPDVLKKAKGE